MRAIETSNAKSKIAAYMSRNSRTARRLTACLETANITGRKHRGRVASPRGFDASAPVGYCPLDPRLNMATTTAPSVESIPVYSNGKWIDLKSKRSGEVFNPSTGKVIAAVPYATAEQTGEGVEAAAAALPAWAETPVVERARLMFRFRAVLEQNFE